MICTKRLPGCVVTCKGEADLGVCSMCVQVLVGYISPEAKSQALAGYRKELAAKGARRRK